MIFEDILTEEVRGNSIFFTMDGSSLDTICKKILEEEKKFGKCISKIVRIIEIFVGNLMSEFQLS